MAQALQYPIQTSIIMKRILILTAAFIFIGSVVTAQNDKTKPTKLVRKQVTVKTVTDQKVIRAERPSGSKLVNKRLQVSVQPVIHETRKK